MIFLFLGPMGFLPVFMTVLSSDPMGIRHERHKDIKNCPQSGDRVQSERCAHTNICADI